jgi:hypothetical protein
MGLPREQLGEAAQVKHTVRQYLAELEQQNPTEEPVHEQERVSTTDPDATYATKGGPARLGYYDNYLVSASNAGIGLDETAIDRQVVPLHESGFQATGDDLLKELLEQLGLLEAPVAILGEGGVMGNLLIEASALVFTTSLQTTYGTRSALLLSRSEDGTLDFDSSLVVILSAEQAKHVGDEENQQYCPQPHAGPATRTPAGMAVVPSTEAENQY